MRTLLAAILIVMPFAAFADETGIQIDHVWARAAPAGHEGAVYLTITDGGAPDTLTGVTTSVAAEAAVHQSIDDHGVMKMRPVGPLPIEPGKPVTFAAGGRRASPHAAGRSRPRPCWARLWCSRQAFSRRMRLAPTSSRSGPSHGG